VNSKGPRYPLLSFLISTIVQSQTRDNEKLGLYKVREEEVLLSHVVGENRQSCCLAIPQEISWWFLGLLLSNIELEEPRCFVARDKICQFSRLTGNSTGTSTFWSNILSELKGTSERSKSKRKILLLHVARIASRNRRRFHDSAAKSTLGSQDLASLASQNLLYHLRQMFHHKHMPCD
jgi:hypothetical protein